MRFYSAANSLIARIQPLQPSNEMRRQNRFRRLARSTTVAGRPLPTGWEMQWARTNRLLPSGVSYLPQHTVTQKRGIALALAGKGDDLFREEFSIAFGFVARLRILQTSSNAVDIAWMSCGPNTLPSRYGMMVMVLPRVCRRDNQGHLSCTKRPRPLFAGDGLSLRFLGRLASPDSVRIRTH